MTDDDEQWSIRTEQDAAWAVGKIAAADLAVQHAKEQAAEYVRRVEAEAEQTRRYFTGHLECYFNEHPPAKGKTVKTPAGAFGFRTVPGGLVVEDRERATTWAEKEFPETVVVQVKKTLDVPAFKRRCGSILAPGCSMKPAEERFYVRPMSVRGGEDGE